MSFSANSQCQIPYCYTYRLLYTGANIVHPRNGKPSRPCANEACAMTAAFSIPHFRQNKKDAHASFQLVEKVIFDFYASCGSTHSIEFALQIHKFREHVSRNLYKGRKNVSAGRGFSSRFARKRGFEREAVRKTKFFDSLKGRSRVLFYLLRAPSTENPSVSDAADLRRTPSARSALRYCRRP